MQRQCKCTYVYLKLNGQVVFKRIPPDPPEVAHVRALLEKWDYGQCSLMEFIVCLQPRTKCPTCRCRILEGETCFCCEGASVDSEPFV